MEIVFQKFKRWDDFDTSGESSAAADLEEHQRFPKRQWTSWIWLQTPLQAPETAANHESELLLLQVVA